MGKAYADNAYREIVYRHPQWEKTAREYEQGFAKSVATDPVVKESARGALTKLSNMLNTYYGVQKFKEEHPEECKNGDFSALYDFAGTNAGEGKVKVGEVLEKSLLRGASGSAPTDPLRDRVSLLDGAGKTEIAAAHQENQSILESAINGEGENQFDLQMRLLQNGLMRNDAEAGQGMDKGRSYERMMRQLTPADKKLMGMTGFAFRDKEEAVKPSDGEKRGNFVSRFLTGIGNVLKSAFRGEKAEETSAKELDQRIYGLTAERADLLFRYEAEQKKQLGTQGDGQKGETVTAEGMLRTVGVSGTVARMLSAYRLMGAGKSDLLYLRLALIGWMCAEGSGSLYEILNGSRLAGVAGYEDLSDAVAMYRSVDPLSPEEIRLYAPNGEFPHETIYKLMVRDVGTARKNRIDQKFAQLRRENGVYDVKTAYDEIDKLEEKLAKTKEDFATQYNLEEMKKLMGTAKDALSPCDKNKLDLYLEDEKQIEQTEDAIQAKKEETISKGFDRWYDYSDLNLFDNSVFDISQNDETDESGVKIPGEMNTQNINANKLSFNIYTTSAFKIMNESQKYGEWGVRLKYGYRKLLKKLFHVKTDNSFRNATSEELDDAGLVDQVFETLRLTNRIAQDALDENAALGLGKVDNEQEEDEMEEVLIEGQEPENKNGESGTDITYRGGKSVSEFSSQDAVYETKSLTSTTKAPSVAEGFYNMSTTGAPYIPFEDYSDGLYDKCSIAEFHIDRRSGVDVSEISQYGGEQELLLPAGVRFRVAKPLREMFYDPEEKSLKEIGNREEAEKIRKGEEPSPEYEDYRLRKVVTLELVSNRNTKFTSKEYLEKRKKREKKREELLNRAEAFERLKLQQEAMGQ